jgi:two-component sensor histidine kinase
MVDPTTRRLAFSVASEPKAGIDARTALLPLSEVLSAERFSDLKLIVTELVGNSFAHGPGGQIHVSVELRADGSIHGVVSDDGHGISASGPFQEPDKGLGLLIVEALAAGWGIREDRSEVWFDLEAPAVPRDQTEARRSPRVDRNEG